MGTVKSISVSPDLTKVIVTIETVREAEPLLTDKTIFWVVKPELFAGNITGLETLISGSYIGMRPSAEPGRQARLHRRARSAGAAGLDQGHDLHARQQAAGLDQPRLADLLPRHRGRHGAGLGYRRPRQQGHHPRLRARALRPVRARRFVVLERLRRVDKDGPTAFSSAWNRCAPLLLGGIAFETPTRHQAACRRQRTSRSRSIATSRTRRRRASAGRSACCPTSRDRSRASSRAPMSRFTASGSAK